MTTRDCMLIFEICLQTLKGFEFQDTKCNQIPSLSLSSLSIIRLLSNRRVVTRYAWLYTHTSHFYEFISAAVNCSICLWPQQLTPLNPLLPRPISPPFQPWREKISWQQLVTNKSILNSFTNDRFQ